MWAILVFGTRMVVLLVVKPVGVLAFMVEHFSKTETQCYIHHDTDGAS